MSENISNKCCAECSTPISMECSNPTCKYCHLAIFQTKEGWEDEKWEEKMERYAGIPSRYLADNNSSMFISLTNAKDITNEAIQEAEQRVARGCLDIIAMIGPINDNEAPIIDLISEKVKHQYNITE